jgi:sugar lactone lactonase YvrE
MSRRTKYYGVVILMISLLVIATIGIRAGALASNEVEVVRSFDAMLNELPEGLTIDKKGNIYVSLGPPFWFGPGDGQIRKISPDGTETVLADFPGGQGPAGVAVNARGDVYFAWPNPTNPATNGVYRIIDGVAERLPGSENIVLANGLAFDKQGNLYVSDSALGSIWRIPRGASGEPEPWAQHEWLAGCDENSPVGANGVAFWKGSLYVASTSRGLLVRIPFLNDGSAGAAEVVAGVVDNACDPDDLVGMDGIALDVHGNVYALLVLQNKLVRIDPNDGSYTVLLTEEDGLYNASSIAFGTGKGDRQSVFMVNYALIPPPPLTSLGPAVLKYDVGVPGLPLP